MLMRSFMPSVILLLVCVAFFVVLVVRSNIHNNQLRLAHQQELAVQRLQETESELLKIDYQQREILNSNDFLEFDCMFDDLDWYNRYRLQNALHDDIASLYLRDQYVDGIWIYWPENKRAISTAHAAAAAPDWLVSAVEQGLTGFHKHKGRLISVVVRDDLLPSENAAMVVLLNEADIRESLQYIREKGM